MERGGTRKLLNEAWRTNGLARRLAVVVILFSSMITTVLTGIELFARYQRDIDGIQARFAFIENSYAPALSASVWVIDENQIRAQLEGLLRLQDIEYLAIATPAAGGSVSASAQPRWSVGEAVSSRSLTHRIPLAYLHRGQMQNIGELTIIASVDNVIDRIMASLVGILINNAVKTLLVATFLLLVFQLVVGTHLEHLANHVRGWATDLSASSDVALRRPPGGRWRPDALDQLEQSLNETRRSLLAAHGELRQSNEKLEIRVRERTRELEQANAELEAFSYSAAHDLRAPLRHITGFSALLEEEMGAAPDADKRAHLQSIAKAAGRMNQLIDDLLAFAQVRSAVLKVETVAVGQLVREVVDDLRPEIGRREISWQIHVLPSVVADRSLLRQVLANLLSNAVKYTRHNDNARIEVGVLQHGPAPAGSTLYIRDNGVGFDMQYAGRLFQPFNRLHSGSEFEGTGIGLSIVAGVVQRHGGKVWAEATKGVGATFYLHFPD